MFSIDRFRLALSYIYAILGPQSMSSTLAQQHYYLTFAALTVAHNLPFIILFRAIPNLGLD
jgi:hypothetical protein